MARLSNNFSNLLVLVLAVPAIIVVLGGDFAVTAAPFDRMQRRSAFPGGEDSILEARGKKTEIAKAAGRVGLEVAAAYQSSLNQRDLFESSHELLGREFAERSGVPE